MTDKNTVFQQKLTLNLRGSLMDLSIPKVLGILNLTPDSFYDGGRNNSITSALKQCEQMLADGADILDIGAYSSRPNAEHISEQEESDRLIPVLRAIVKEFPQAFLSIDTFRSRIAESAIQEGTHLINDISGGEMDPGIYRIAGKYQVPYILMHMKGNPQTMVRESVYENLLMEVLDYFLARIARLRDAGVVDIILDPGFGFAKTADQSFELLKRMQEMQVLGLPILAGLSRKSMIYKTLGTTAENALNGTSVLNTIALLNGAKLLRVHDVREAVETIQLCQKLKD